MTQFKQGDRVRVTYEGEVVDSHSNLNLKVKTVQQFYLPYLNDPAVTIEKIREPEPTWVNGDVVAVGVCEPFVRVGGKWLWVNGGPEPHRGDECVSDYWKRDEVKIYFKADA